MKRSIVFLLILSMLLGNVSVFAATQEANPDTSDWFVYEYPKADDVAGTVLDASDLLDAPAGKHGFLVDADTNRFYFEDGTDIRFNGMNLAGASTYMEYDDAVETAKRISQSGFNLVRLHLIDSGSRDGIWGRKADGGRVLREDIMDRLCFLFSELKKRGVYMMIDLVISIPLTADMPYADLENIGSGVKQVSYFAEDLIALQKEYAEQLLGYYNPYTGMCLKDDPALALVALKNEDAITSEPSLGSSYYEEMLQADFNAWLLEKYGTRDALKTAWETMLPADETAKTKIYVNGTLAETKPALLDNEDPAAGTVALFSPQFQTDNYLQYDDYWAIGRTKDREEFLAKVQEDFYTEMIDYLRNDLGVKCRITGVTVFSSTGKDHALAYSNRNTDYIDSHHYSSMTSTTAYSDGTTRDTKPRSLLETTNGGYLGAGFIRAVYGMPHTISEWNDVGQNKYKSESMFLVSAYSSLVGAHPFCFSWTNNSEGISKVTTESYKKSNFGFSEAPEQMAAMPAASRIYLREDVAEAKVGYYPLRQRGDEMYARDRYNVNADTRWMTRVGFIGKTGMIFDDKEYNPSANSKQVLYLARQAEKTNEYVSVTGELSLSGDLFTVSGKTESATKDQIFKVNTEKSQVVSGYISGQDIELDDMIVNVDNYFATISLGAVEDKPIYQGGTLLLTVLGDTRNTGMVMSDDELTMTEAGTSPVIVEPIEGTITLKTKNNVTVYALNSSGQRTAQKETAKTTEGYTVFELEASDKAMHYEIVVENAAGTTKNTHISLGNTEMPEKIFSDVDSTVAYKDEIEELALYTNLTDSIGENFKPNDTITKGEFIQLLIRGLRLENSVWYSTSSTYFTGDVATTDPYYGELSVAYRMGAITRTKEWVWSSLSNKYFIYPNAKLTRGNVMEYAAKIAKRCYRNTEPDASFSMNQYNDYSTYASDSNLDNYRYIMGQGWLDAKNGNIAANDAITRAEAAHMIYQMAWGE